MIQECKWTWNSKRNYIYIYLLVIKKISIVVGCMLLVAFTVIQVAVIKLSDTWFNRCLQRSINSYYWMAFHHTITFLHFNSFIELQPVFILGWVRLRSIIVDERNVTLDVKKPKFDVELDKMEKFFEDRCIEVYIGGTVDERK